jgi:hypothetical protein
VQCGGISKKSNKNQTKEHCIIFLCLAHKPMTGGPSVAELCQCTVRGRRCRGGRAVTLLFAALQLVVLKKYKNKNKWVCW